MTPSLKLERIYTPLLSASDTQRKMKYTCYSLFPRSEISRTRSSSLSIPKQKYTTISKTILVYIQSHVRYTRVSIDRLAYSRSIQSYPSVPPRDPASSFLSRKKEKRSPLRARTLPAT